MSTAETLSAVPIDRTLRLMMQPKPAAAPPPPLPAPPPPPPPSSPGIPPLARYTMYVTLGLFGNSAHTPMLAVAMLLWIDPTPIDSLVADVVLGALFRAPDCGGWLLLGLGAVWVAAGCLSLVVALPDAWHRPALALGVFTRIALAALGTAPAMLMGDDLEAPLAFAARIWPSAPVIAYLVLVSIDEGLLHGAHAHARLRYGGLLCCTPCALSLIVATLVLVGAQSACFVLQTRPTAAASSTDASPALAVDALDVHEALRLAQAQHYNLVSPAEKNV